MFFRNAAVALMGAASLVSAAPANDISRRSGLACSGGGLLSTEACNVMSKIGFQGVGLNPSSGNMFVGDSGANTFKFTNGGSDAVTVIGWIDPAGSYTGMDLNVSPTQISYTLSKGKSVTISIANGVSGAFAGLYSDTSLFDGQMDETWLEFTTGDYATINVSREVNMQGHSIAATVSGTGCKSNMDQCVFKCKSGNRCGDSGSYELDACQPSDQKGATYGVYQGNPSGGCTGFSNGGHVDVQLNGDGASTGSQGGDDNNSSPSSAPAAPKSSPTPAPAPAPAHASSPSAAPSKPSSGGNFKSQPSPAPAPAAPSTTPADDPQGVEVGPGGMLREYSVAAWKAQAHKGS